MLVHDWKSCQPIKAVVALSLEAALGNIMWTLTSLPWWKAVFDWWAGQYDQVMRACALKQRKSVGR